MNPVGPEDPSIYWRRRAVVVLVVSVVVWLAWMGVGAALGSSDDGAQAAQPSPSPSFGLSLAGGDGVDPNAGDSDLEAGAEGPVPSPGGPCRDSDVVVSAQPDAASVAKGQGLGLTLTVGNAGSVACTRDVGAAANELTISADAALVWSSDHCNPSDAVNELLLEAGESWSTSMTWTGTTSTPGCAADQPQVASGDYDLVARNGAVESDPTPFTVE